MVTDAKLIKLQNSAKSAKQKADASKKKLDDLNQQLKKEKDLLEKQLKA